MKIAATVFFVWLCCLSIYIMLESLTDKDYKLAIRLATATVVVATTAIFSLYCIIQLWS